MANTRARVAASRQGHLANLVFDQLAAEILSGALAPGSLLSSEGELSEQFGLSRLTVRQALHRLADLGLIMLRQGCPTRVGDPAQADDIRLLDLFYRLAPGDHSPIDPRDIIEKQLLQGLCQVEIAERRASDGALEQIGKLAQSATAVDSEAGFHAFEQRFWEHVVSAGGNRILRMEVSWWYKVLRERPSAERVVPSPLSLRLAFYRELGRRLQARDGAVRFYLDSITPLLQALFNKE
jgi:GntR family transcriptional regulator, transcriptional repressor for pyruvate dehydrogenase complex